MEAKRRNLFTFNFSVMKKFIIKTLLFITPIIVLAIPLDLCISNAISKWECTSFAAGELSVWNDIFDKKINADIAVYGSSRAWVHFNTNLITDSLGIESYNFGIDGHDFWLQYFRHETYLKNNPPPKVIIISVDYLSLQKRKDLYNYNQFLPYMLWNENLMNYTSEYIGFQDRDFKIPLWRYMGKTDLLAYAIRLLFQEPCTQKRERGYEGMELKWNDDLKKAKRKMGSYKITLHQESIELFDKFLGECKNNDIKVLMVYAPIYFEGIEYIENNEEILKVYKSFADKYELSFLDYTKNEICYDKSYFYNASHLNKKGANLFTNQLIQDLKNLNAQ